MPYVVKMNDENSKQQYLKDLFNETYLKDITERNNIKNVYSFELLMKILASSIGSYTNPSNIEKTFKAKKRYHIVTRQLNNILNV